MKDDKETTELGEDIPKCGGKAKPKDPPPGAGAGKWVCDEPDWVYEEEGGGV